MKSIKYAAVLVAATAMMSVTGVPSALAAEAPNFKLKAGETFPVNFTSTSGATTLITTKGREVHCETDTNEGEITATTSIKKLVVKFHKCTAKGPFGTLTCTTASESGTIVTDDLNGLPVYTSAAEAATAVGVSLTPESGAVFASFTCTGTLVSETLTVGVSSEPTNGKDSLVCGITPINTFSTKSTLACKQKGGVQEPSEYWLGGTAHIDYLETKGEGSEPFPFEQSGQETSGGDEITTAKEVELKAA